MLREAAVVSEMFARNPGQAVGLISFCTKQKDSNSYVVCVVLTEQTKIDCFKFFTRNAFIRNIETSGGAVEFFVDAFAFIVKLFQFALIVL